VEIGALNQKERPYAPAFTNAWLRHWNHEVTRPLTISLWRWVQKKTCAGGHLCGKTLDKGARSEACNIKHWC